jgi:hypothetical protein
MGMFPTSLLPASPMRAAFLIIVPIFQAPVHWRKGDHAELKAGRAPI